MNRFKFKGLCMAGNRRKTSHGATLKTLIEFQKLAAEMQMFQEKFISGDFKNEFSQVKECKIIARRIIRKLDKIEKKMKGTPTETTCNTIKKALQENLKQFSTLYENPETQNRLKEQTQCERYYVNPKSNVAVVDGPVTPEAVEEFKKSVNVEQYMRAKNDAECLEVLWRNLFIFHTYTRNNIAKPRLKATIQLLEELFDKLLSNLSNFAYLPDSFPQLSSEKMHNYLKDKLFERIKTLLHNGQYKDVEQHIVYYQFQPRSLVESEDILKIAMSAAQRHPAGAERILNMLKGTFVFQQASTLTQPSFWNSSALEGSEDSLDAEMANMDRMFLFDMIQDLQRAPELIYDTSIKEQVSFLTLDIIRLAKETYSEVIDNLPISHRHH